MTRYYVFDVSATKFVKTDYSLGKNIHDKGLANFITAEEANNWVENSSQLTKVYLILKLIVKSQ